MSDDLELRRKRLLYRSWHRGAREMDLLLGRFAEAHLARLSADQLDRYARLLENSDPDIYDWVTGQKAVPPAFDDDVFRMVRRFSDRSIGH